jgi:hypothetical protein
MTNRVPLLLAASLLLVPGTRADAQVVLVDEGTFSLLANGTRVGREDFSIRRTTGGGFVAQGNLLRGDLRATVTLNADSAGGPERFRLETVRAGRPEEEVTGERRGGLWSGLAARSSGERGSEFRLPPGARVADDGAVHHLWFVLFGAPGTGPRLDPRRLALDTLVVEAAGEERVTIGLEELDARKWVIRTVGREAIREVWTDARGRLLRVRVSAEGLEAIRDEPPPETIGAPPAYDGAQLTSIYR